MSSLTSVAEAHAPLAAAVMVMPTGLVVVGLTA